MASRTATLTVDRDKEAVSIATAGSASGNVAIVFDDTINTDELSVTVQKLLEKILEDEY